MHLILNYSEVTKTMPRPGKRLRENGAGADKGAAVYSGDTSSKGAFNRR
jgi:hypothetical protein